MLSSLFIDSVQQAVSQSTQNDQCLVVYISDSNGENIWLNKWFNLNSNNLNTLKASAVWLRLIEDTNELQYFEAIFPGVAIPSLYVIYKGEIKLLLFDDPNDQSSINEYWEQLQVCLTENTPRKSIPLHDQSSESATTNKSFKEQVEETTQQMYKEKIAKERRLDHEERERILRLVRADKKERKAREHKREPTIERENTPVQDNIKNKEILHSTNCVLQIKLTNGNTLRHTFNHDDTLDTVRKWVDSNRTDEDIPYAFHRSIPRYTFQESDELKTLESLELTPRSMLILKPLETRSNPLNISELQTNPGLFGKVYSSFSSFWSRENNSMSPAASPNINNNNQNNGLSGRSSLNNSDININDNSIINPRYGPHTNSNNNRGNPTSRSLTPNVYKFHNNNDDDDDIEAEKDKEKETYNGNAIKLEKRKDDDDNEN